VSGTNTDAVLLDDTKVSATNKALTTDAVTSGIVGALEALQDEHAFDPG
jgi:N-methylhydantoinase A/oxoprolinase/acetone carboxylase beta subunit